MTIAVFDFDGTITCKDTLLEFIKHSRGKAAFYAGFLLYSPLLVLMKMKQYPNWKVKQKVFAHFFKGISVQDFDWMCKAFFEDNKSLVYGWAKEEIEMLKAKGEKVVIISASFENWVSYFGEWLGVDEVIGTRLEVKGERLTGRFETKNCYGQEKVNRLLEKYPNRAEYQLTAYGDSIGDKELFAFADTRYKIS